MSLASNGYFALEPILEPWLLSCEVAFLFFIYYSFANCKPPLYGHTLKKSKIVTSILGDYLLFILGQSHYYLILQVLRSFSKREAIRFKEDFKKKKNRIFVLFQRSLCAIEYFRIC